MNEHARSEIPPLTCPATVGLAMCCMYENPKRCALSLLAWGRDSRKRTPYQHCSLAPLACGQCRRVQSYVVCRTQAHQARNRPSRPGIVVR